MGEGRHSRGCGFFKTEIEMAIDLKSSGKAREGMKGMGEVKEINLELWYDSIEDESI